MSQDGTQAIRRAAAILKRIAHVPGASSATLKEIAEALELSRSTAHRILKCLVETGLAHYDPATRRYEIGMLGYELGLAVTDRVLDIAPYAAAVDRIAARTGVTSYLLRRSGIEAVCVHKAEARSVIRVIPVEVGQRRFLGVGAGATALLAALDDDTVERIVASVGPELASFNDLTEAGVRAAVAEARRTGFAESRARAYASIYGLARAIASPGRAPDFAVSIAAHTSSVNEDLIRSWREILREEAGTAASRAAGPG